MTYVLACDSILLYTILPHKSLFCICFPRQNKKPAELAFSFVSKAGFEHYMFSTGCRYFSKIAGNLIEALGQKLKTSRAGFFICVEGGLRSRDLRVMSAVLLPAELPRQ